MDAEERAARERLETLFAAINRLSPDELARIGFRAASPEERQPLLDAVAAAAVASGRQALVAEARAQVREAVMGRYASGILHPTFIALNWGLSQGTVEDRIAIAETLADAAASAIVEDVLDPEVATTLALDAAAITGMATGEAYEGSLGRLLRDPEDPELGPSRALRVTRRVGVVYLIALILLTVVGAGIEATVLVCASIAGVLVAAGRAARNRPEAGAGR
jgi:hypothetical protein